MSLLENHLGALSSLQVRRTIDFLDLSQELLHISLAQASLPGSSFMTHEDH